MIDTTMKIPLLERILICAVGIALFMFPAVILRVTSLHASVGMIYVFATAIVLLGIGGRRIAWVRRHEAPPKEITYNGIRYIEVPPEKKRWWRRWA